MRILFSSINRKSLCACMLRERRGKAGHWTMFLLPPTGLPDVKCTHIQLWDLPKKSIQHECPSLNAAFDMHEMCNFPLQNVYTMHAQNNQLIAYRTQPVSVRSILFYRQILRKSFRPEFSIKLEAYSAETIRTVLFFHFSLIGYCFHRSQFNQWIMFVFILSI